MKKIITVQDISCVGKCSLTVALPIISAMGVEACVLPTAVLSTHTAFKGFTFRDLTSDIEPICRHWKDENIQFNAIYTGYLGSFEQLDLMHKLMADFGSTALKIVDPCMADNGKLYPGFTQEFAFAMAKLCGKADVVVPNLTEASFMLGIPYQAAGYNKDYIISVLKQLAQLRNWQALPVKSELHLTTQKPGLSAGISTKKCPKISMVPETSLPAF